jgi:hypothetical protein
MISEQAICGSSVSEKDDETGVTLLLEPVPPSELRGVSLLPGIPALVPDEELSGSADVGSSEQAENAPSIAMQDPAKSHFFMFIRAILFLCP